MAGSKVSVAPTTLPPGWSTVPFPKQGEAALRVCLVLRREADPLTSHLVLLRETLDTQAFLGCITDQANQLREWVELWLPNRVEQADAVMAAHRSLSKAAQDERWRRMVEAIDKSEPGAVIHTGWEMERQPPMLIDLSRLKTETPMRGEVRFNPAGGPMLVRRHGGLRFERYLSTLTAGNAPTTQGGDATGVDVRAGWLFLGRHGRAGRLSETLHLKLRAIADAIRSVAVLVKNAHLPLLNIDANAFAVDLTQRGQGLPRLWSARAEILQPGSAIEVAIPDSAERFYIAGQPGGSRNAGASIYSPKDVHGAVGSATVMLREVNVNNQGITVLRGTLTTQERLSPSPRDLLWLRLIVAAAPVEVYARFEPEKSPVEDERQFRTIGRKLGPEVTRGLKAAEGMLLELVSFEHLPMLSTPCDLYALAVLAVRALLVNSQTTLPAALDEIFKLAQAVKAESNKHASLPDTIAEIVSKDSRWLESIGPQRLTDEPLRPEEAAELIPAALWWQVVAAILRMFPGHGAFSHARDYGDAPADGLHKVFDGTLNDFETLVLRSRSLIVIDWRHNREVRSVIARFLGTGAETGPKAADPPARVQAPVSKASTDGRASAASSPAPPRTAAAPAKAPAKAPHLKKGAAVQEIKE